MSNSLAFAEIIQPDFIIGSGGAYIYYQGKVLFKSVFSKDEVYTFVKKALELTDKKLKLQLTLPTINITGTAA